MPTRARAAHRWVNNFSLIAALVSTRLRPNRQAPTQQTFYIASHLDFRASGARARAPRPAPRARAPPF